MEQFSLEKYLANPSRKVVTRNGRNVRIVCTDKKDFDYPIVALIENKLEGFEGALYYTKDGKYIANESSDSDLFFASEKHEGWINVYRYSDGGHAYAGAVYDSKEDAEKRKIIGELCCRYVFHSEEEARQNRGEQAIATVKIEWGE